MLRLHEWFRSIHGHFSFVRHVEQMKDHLSPAASYQGHKGHFAQFASRLTFKGPQVDGGGRGGTERGRRRPRRSQPLRTRWGRRRRRWSFLCFEGLVCLLLVLGATPKKWNPVPVLRASSTQQSRRAEENWIGQCRGVGRSGAHWAKKWTARRRVVLRVTRMSSSLRGFL